MRAALALAFVVSLLSAALAGEARAEDTAAPPAPLEDEGAASDPATAPATDPATDPATEPATDTAAARPPAADTTTTAPPTFRDDPDAEAAHTTCARLAETVGSDPAAVRTCYLDLVTRWPGTVAALKAETSLFILRSPLVQGSGNAGLNIPAGRLGITTAVGAFGLWNAIAGGIVTGVNVPNVNPTALIAGTGVVGVAAGIGFGIGGYFLAEKLQLDEGAARLVASGLLWGTVLGTSIAPTIAFSDTGGTAGFNLGIASVVGAGYLAGGAALLLTSMVSFDEAQVSMINSGGAIGATLGLLLLPNLAAAGVTEVAPYSLAFAGTTTAGLAAGGLLGRSLQLTWGEALLCDLAAVLGGFAGGTASLLMGTVTGSPSVTFMTAIPAIGVVGGYGAGLLFVSQWRLSRGAPIWRDGPELRPIVSSVSTGRVNVPTVGVVGRF
jgi:hypothetical protein